MGYAGGGAGNAEGLFQSIDIFFDMTGTTDNGLTFGASVDLDDATEFNNVDATDTYADFTVFVSGAFGELTMGDTDGAMDWAITEAVGQPGSIEDESTEHSGYVGGNALDGAQDAQILRYNYSFGDLGFAVSVDGADEDTIGTGAQIGLSYDIAFAGGSVALGLGYGSTEVSTDASTRATGVYRIGGVVMNQGTDIDAVNVSAALTLDSGFSAAVAYTDIDTNQASASFQHYQLSAGYEFGPFAVGVNYGDFDGSSTRSGYGVSASYDLGGGASLHAGYGSSDNAGTVPDVDRYSFGLAMSF